MTGFSYALREAAKTVFFSALVELIVAIDFFPHKFQKRIGIKEPYPLPPNKKTLK